MIEIPDFYTIYYNPIAQTAVSADELEDIKNAEQVTGHSQRSSLFFKLICERDELGDLTYSFPAYDDKPATELSHNQHEHIVKCLKRLICCA